MLRKSCSAILAALLAVLCCAAQAAAQTAPTAQTPLPYRPNEALGEKLAKTPFVASPSSPGGKDILGNSCIYKDTFSLSPSEELLEHCDIPAALARFTAKYGPPAQAGEAPGGKKLLEYHLEYKDNQYHVRYFVGCAAGKTEAFAMVECTREKNRVMPGGPPGKRPGSLPGKMRP